MAIVTIRRKALSIGAAVAVWGAALGGPAALASLVRDARFAGRGDHSDVVLVFARIMMARADAPGALQDPFARP